MRKRHQKPHFLRDCVESLRHRRAACGVDGIGARHLSAAPSRHHHGKRGHLELLLRLFQSQPDDQGGLGEGFVVHHPPEKDEHDGGNQDDEPLRPKNLVVEPRGPFHGVTSFSASFSSRPSPRLSPCASLQFFSCVPSPVSPFPFCGFLSSGAGASFFLA